MKTCPYLLAALLAGCNAQPLEYSKTGDIMSGPGSPDPGRLAALAGRYGLDVDLASIPRLAAAYGLMVA